MEALNIAEVKIVNLWPYSWELKQSSFKKEGLDGQNVWIPGCTFKINVTINGGWVDKKIIFHKKKHIYIDAAEPLH